MDEFQKIIPSENILKLRKLTEEISSIEENECCLLAELKNIVDKGINIMLSSKTERTKLKHYETIFLEIKKLLE